MKKIMNTSLIYFVLAMAGGVFYREFTKWNGYTEQTTLLEENALLKKFFVLYNIALPFMSLMMLIRGTV